MVGGLPAEEPGLGKGGGEVGRGLSRVARELQAGLEEAAAAEREKDVWLSITLLSLSLCVSVSSPF